MGQPTKTPFGLSHKKVWVAGHHGMVGSAVFRRLQSENCDILSVSRKDLNLTRQDDVESWMDANRPDVVFLAAAKVGGILANSTYPADFIYENLMIESNVIHAAYKTNVQKLLFLGSSCIYPKDSKQPMNEQALLTGSLEPTNEWYAIAKIAGIKLCQAYRKQHSCDFISVMPTNLIGEGDNYDLQNSHVAAALMVKAHKAKMENSETLEIWGTGEPKREFMHVDDLADALVFLMKNYSEYEIVNVGSGYEITIRALAEIIAELAGFEGELVYDTSKPDGVMRKLMNSSKIQKMGWQPRISLKDGLALAYDAYLKSLRQA